MNMIFFVTSRAEEYRELMVFFLHKSHIRYDHVIFSAPYGERILINGRKSFGLDMSVAVNTERDLF